MGLAPLDGQAEEVAGCCVLPPGQYDTAHGHIWSDMYAKSPVITFGQPLLNEILGTMTKLLRLLEGQQHSAGESVRQLRQPFGCRQQCRPVDIMAASVHHARIDGLIRQRGMLLYRQGIDICPLNSGCLWKCSRNLIASSRSICCNIFCTSHFI